MNKVPQYSKKKPKRDNSEQKYTRHGSIKTDTKILNQTDFEIRENDISKIDSIQKQQHQQSIQEKQYETAKILQHTKDELNKTVCANQQLEKQLKEEESELEECHSKIARLVQTNNEQKQELQEMQDKIESFTVQQSQLLDQSKMNVGILEQEIVEKDRQLQEGSQYVQQMEEKMAEMQQKYQVVQEENIKFQEQIKQKSEENNRLYSRLEQVEQSIDNIYYQKLNNSQSEVEHIKQDMERLIQLLKDTKEFKEFSIYCEDSKDVRFLKRIYTAYKGNDKRSGNHCCGNKCCKSQMKENFLWVPKDAYTFMNHFITKNNGKLSQENIEEVLFGLNKYFTDREQSQIQRIQKKLEQENEKLKRDLEKQTPYDEILAQRKVFRLKGRLQQSIRGSSKDNWHQQSSMMDASQIFVCERSKTPGRNFVGNSVNLSTMSGISGNKARQTNLLQYGEVVKLATEYESQIRQKEFDIDQLTKQLQIQENENTTTNKVVYMEGALWVLEKLTKEVGKCKQKSAKILDQFQIELQKYIIELNIQETENGTSFLQIAQWLTDNQKEKIANLQNKIDSMRESTKNQIQKIQQSQFGDVSQIQATAATSNLHSKTSQQQLSTQQENKLTQQQKPIQQMFYYDQDSICNNENDFNYINQQQHTSNFGYLQDNRNNTQQTQKNNFTYNNNQSDADISPIKPDRDVLKDIIYKNNQMSYQQQQLQQKQNQSSFIKQF